MESGLLHIVFFTVTGFAEAVDETVTEQPSETRRGKSEPDHDFDCFICGHIFYNGTPAPGIEVYYYSKKDRGWPKPIRDDTVTSEDGFFDLRYTVFNEDNEIYSRNVNSFQIVIRHQFIVNETDPMEECESNFSLTWIELSRYRGWPNRMVFELSELGNQTRCSTKDDDKEKMVYGAEDEVITSKFAGRVLCNEEPVDNFTVTLRRFELFHRFKHLNEKFAVTRTKNGGYYSFHVSRLHRHSNVALEIRHNCRPNDSSRAEPCYKGWCNSYYFKPGWSYYYIGELKEAYYELDFELSQPIFNQEVEDYWNAVIEAKKGLPELFGRVSCNGTAIANQTIFLYHDGSPESIIAQTTTKDNGFYEFSENIKIEESMVLKIRHQCPLEEEEFSNCVDPYYVTTRKFKKANVEETDVNESLEVIVPNFQKDFELEKRELKPSQDWVDSRETFCN